MQWKDIEGFEGRYQVSCTGEVKTSKGLILSQSKRKYCDQGELK